MKKRTAAPLTENSDFHEKISNIFLAAPKLHASSASRPWIVLPYESQITSESSAATLYRGVAMQLRVVDSRAIARTAKCNAPSWASSQS